MAAPLVGLTGGIACGKSAVAAILKELGVPVIDADRIARDVVEPGQPALEDIRAHFGNEVIGRDGRLDRAALGQRVFSDPAARKTLNAITHPRIAVASQSAIAAHSSAPVVVYEAPLLYENNLEAGMSKVIVVSLPASEQIQRLMARDQLSEQEARSRIAAQMPVADKAARADYVIDNSGTLVALESTVHTVWSRVLEDLGIEQ